MASSPCDDLTADDRVNSDGGTAGAALGAAPQHAHPTESDVAAGAEDRRRQRQECRVDTDRRPLPEEETGAADAYRRDGVGGALRIDQIAQTLPLRRRVVVERRHLNPKPIGLGGKRVAIGVAVAAQRRAAERRAAEPEAGARLAEYPHRPQPGRTAKRL